MRARPAPQSGADHAGQRSCTEPVAPAPGDIHLWFLDLDALPALSETLDARERERAQRLQSDRDRDRYRAAHHALRAVLAHYLGCAAAAVHFHIDPGGKPRLAPGMHGAAAPAFNLSHSGRRAVVAVAADGDVGVDIEADSGSSRDMETMDMLATFSAAERRVVQALDAATLARTFRTAWTRKEAVLKALGTGFTVEPSDLAVGLDAGASCLTPQHLPALAAAMARRAAPAGCIHLLSLAPAGDATVSVARIDTPISGLKHFTFPSDSGAQSGAATRP